MRFIVIGCLGSMGRRRIRCLKSLGHENIVGYDVADYKKANPTCWYTDMLDEIENFLENPMGIYEKVDGIIVSVPPLQKQPYINLAAQYNIPCFCEADIKTYDTKYIQIKRSLECEKCWYSPDRCRFLTGCNNDCNKAENMRTIKTFTNNYYSSASMRFYPAIQKIKEILDAGTLGKVYTFTYHCGNSLYDWHPGTNMKTYYAATKEAGGCKEIFPFELSWLSMLFGTPVDAKGFIDKKLDDKDIMADDVFATTVKFGKKVKKIAIKKGADCVFQGEELIGTKNPSDIRFFDELTNMVTGTILIDIVSRPAIRKLRIVGEKCNLLWNWNDDHIELEYPDGEISMIFYPKGNAADGYNSNITEDMYIEEMRSFISAIQGKPYYYPKKDEEACIKMLNMIGG